MVFDWLEVKSGAIFVQEIEINILEGSCGFTLLLIELLS